MTILQHVHVHSLNESHSSLVEESESDSESFYNSESELPHGGSFPAEQP